MGYKPLQVAPGFVAGSLMGGPALFLGHSFQEVTGTAPASYVIWDGSPASGLALLRVSLSAGQSTRDWFQPRPKEFTIGCYVQVTSGSVAGLIDVDTETHQLARAMPVVVVSAEALAQYGAGPGVVTLGES